MRTHAYAKFKKRTHTHYVVAPQLLASNWSKVEKSKKNLDKDNNWGAIIG